ncbi:MAG: adenosylmethionine decarboxylase [Legionellales bacterium]|nr:adenosylmethionine decarboxylase [Legionellales bacterium]
MQSKNPITLHGFNNLTKILSFNLYDICYAKKPNHKKEYIRYIDEAYNAERLTKILTEVTEIIDAKILNIASQDYEPEGASVTMLIAEDTHKESVVSHLDKSHITVHTYPEIHPDDGICTFRADISVSTCGEISPLKALNHLIESFESDIVILDYIIRGFTRDIQGNKHYTDHPIHSIQDFLIPKTIEEYQIVDVNVYQENIFHSKLIIKETLLDNYLFGSGKEDFTKDELDNIRKKLRHEMLEIFYGRNVSIGALHNIG